MSALVGVWNRNGEPLHPSLLPRAIETLSHRSSRPARIWSAGSIGLAALPAYDADASHLEGAASGTALAFDGRLDNRDELLADLPGTMLNAEGTACALAGVAVF